MGMATEPASHHFAQARARAARDRRAAPRLPAGPIRPFWQTREPEAPDPLHGARTRASTRGHLRVPICPRHIASGCLARSAAARLGAGSRSPARPAASPRPWPVHSGHGSPRGSRAIARRRALSTGMIESRRDGIETLDAIRRIKTEMPGVRTILGLSNISFGLNPAARQVLNSVFLHEAAEAGLDAAIVHASKILPLHRIEEEARQ